MSEPPRRRRSAPPPRRGSPGANVLPTIALGVGVVVAGLGIGAFLSALQSKNGAMPIATPSGGLPVVTAVAQPTRGPVAIATIVSHARPSASPSESPSASPTTTPTAIATTSATPTVAPTRTPKPPTFPPLAAAKPTPRVTPPPVVALATAHPFAVQAESTVRRYLDALIAGNEGSAYAAFGATPGDPNVRLTEEAFIDRGARIASLRTTHADATGATVEAEIVSSRGSYFATYHVSGSPSGPLIDGHDYIRE